jgi:hypothetical protein
MKKKTLFMGTTKIDPHKTEGEIRAALVASGARQIATDYGSGGTISALRFIIPVQGQELAFALPVRSAALVHHLRGDKAQAERTAWRQLLRWVEAQFAMIDCGMVKAEEVYAPYMLQGNGQTLYECLATTQFKAIEAPKGTR